jgi:outer membrane protein assembly factor BamB
MKLLPAARALACVAVAALLGPRATEAQSLKWNYTTNGQVDSSPVLGPDGSLYVGSHDNNIYAINATGRLKWKFATNGQVDSSPVLGPETTCTWGPSTTTSTPSTRRAA